MGEREIRTQEEKDKATLDARAIQKEVISSEHGMVSQQDLMGLSQEELVHRFVEIADRGFVSMRLNVPLPEDWHGEWIANDPASIAEAKMKGFITDDKFAVKHGLHSDGTGSPIIGDVIHMICPKRIKQAHDAAARIRYERVHGKARDLPEESQFESSVQNLGLSITHKNAKINTSVQMHASQSELLTAVRGS